MASAEKCFCQTHSQWPNKLEGHLHCAKTQCMFLLKEPGLLEDWEDAIQNKTEHCQKPTNWQMPVFVLLNFSFPAQLVTNCAIPWTF